MVSARIDGLAIVGTAGRRRRPRRRRAKCWRGSTARNSTPCWRRTTRPSRTPTRRDRPGGSADLASRQAQLGFAANDYERAQKLGGGVMSTSAIEQREMALKTAQAQLASARSALSVAEADRASRDAERRELLVRVGRTEVKAPVAGVVSRRSAKLGASASTAGEPLFRIIADGAIDLEAEVARAVAGAARGRHARPAQTAGRLRRGRRRRCGSSIRKSTRRAAPARCASRSPTSAHARIGAFASGEIDLDAPGRRRRAGLGAQDRRRNARLLVVRDGKVEERKVSRASSRATRSRSATASRWAKSSSRAPRRSCARATACGR